jgi:hypothetical protein
LATLDHVSGTALVITRGDLLGDPIIDFRFDVRDPTMGSGTNFHGQRECPFRLAPFLFPLAKRSALFGDFARNEPGGLARRH